MLGKGRVGGGGDGRHSEYMQQAFNLGILVVIIIAEFTINSTVLLFSPHHHCLAVLCTNNPRSKHPARNIPKYKTGVLQSYI
jgi:hypothetical protein